MCTFQHNYYNTCIWRIIEIVSGVLTWIAVGSVASDNVLYSSSYNTDVPWSLIVAAISGTLPFLLAVAIGFKVCNNYHAIRQEELQKKKTKEFYEQQSCNSSINMLNSSSTFQYAFTQFCVQCGRTASRHDVIKQYWTQRRHEQIPSVPCWNDSVWICYGSYVKTWHANGEFYIKCIYVPYKHWTKMKSTRWQSQTFRIKPTNAKYIVARNN